MTSTRLHEPHHSKGFSLTELMVSLFIIGILMGGIYIVYSQSSDAFRVQSQVVEAYHQLRFGLEHLKKDIRNAGFLATPNTRPGVDFNLGCPTDADYMAVSVMPDTGEVWNTADNVNIKPASIVLFGGYPSPHVYLTESINGDTVTLQLTAQFPKTQQEFAAIFNSHHVLHIVNNEQYDMYYPIVGGNFAARSVVLAQSVPTTSAGGGGKCGTLGDSAGLEVNVVGFVRYRVVLKREGGNITPTSLLIREEMEMTSGILTVVPDSGLVIAENVVDLQFYDFVFDEGSVDDPALKVYSTMDKGIASTDGSGLLGNLDLSSKPHALRALSVKLFVRASGQDETVFFEPKDGPNAPLTGFKVDSTLVGAAPVMSMGGRVMMPSIALRNLK